MESKESNNKNQNASQDKMGIFQSYNLIPDLERAIVDPNYTNALINMLQASILLQTLNYDIQPSYNNDKEMKNTNQTNQSSNSDKSQRQKKQEVQEKKNKKSLSAYRNSKIKSQGPEMDQSYSPDSSGDRHPRRYKASQTKNVTKNFGKAIITFILKERDLTSKVLRLHKVDQQQFLEYASNLKYKTNSIRGLRALWIDQSNPFAKQLRILSFEFLRKHCLNYLFYSRVRNHSRGLKYRKKILEGIHCPEKFTFMKQY